MRQYGLVWCVWWPSLAAGGREAPPPGYEYDEQLPSLPPPAYAPANFSLGGSLLNGELSQRRRWQAAMAVAMSMAVAVAGNLRK